MNERFRFDPDTYLDLLHGEIPAYDELQDRAAAATRGIDVERILDLGVGTGETSARVCQAHPDATIVGIDENDDMLAAAGARLPGADLREARLEEELPDGPFDLVVSALAVHHLDGAAKADLFVRVGERLNPGGRFVLADLVVPVDPSDVVTEIDGVYDTPSSIAEQLSWLEAAGLEPDAAWAERDLAVLVGNKPAGS